MTGPEMFTHFYYLLWTDTAMSDDTIAQAAYLDTVKYRDIWGMAELTEWLDAGYPTTFGRNNLMCSGWAATKEQIQRHWRMQRERYEERWQKLFVLATPLVRKTVDVGYSGR